jgi:hypothetical protein
MIKIRESVPSVYYDSSRDFQLIGHLFDLVLNSTKTEADLLFNLPLSTNSDDQLLELLAFTLGLRLSKEKYTSAQLRAVCSVAPYIMRNKGSKKAIELLCNALMRADSIEGKSFVELDGNKLTIHITDISTCHDILYEILPYIVPAGIVFNIKEMSSFSGYASAHAGLTDSVVVGTFKATDEITYMKKLPKKDASALLFTKPEKSEGNESDWVLSADNESAWAGLAITNSSSPILYTGPIEIVMEEE